MAPGRLLGLGIGPGDPELLTLKALRLLQAAPVVAYPVSERGTSVARTIVAAYLHHAPLEVPMYFPFSAEHSAQPYYDQAATTLAAHLSDGLDVAVLCEGDPFFYGTFMYLFTRLSQHFDTEVVPGVSSLMGSASVLGTPLTYRNDVFMVLSAILPAETLATRLALADAAVIIKLGKHFPKVYAVLQQLGFLSRARYVQCATMPEQQMLTLDQVDPAQVPYFSMIVLPSQWRMEHAS
jgi:precorrin-2/cobalt-factor-2 C20-methyltransferase